MIGGFRTSDFGFHFFKIMLIDTHCHLDFPDFDADRDDVVAHAQAAGVGIVINVGASLKGCQASVELASRHENIYAAVGIHPHDAKDCDEGVVKQIKVMLKDKKVVAVGEIGLDYFRNFSPRPIQEKIFKMFIELALEMKRPLVIHSRGALERTMEILRQYPRIADHGVVFHCFSGDISFLKACLDNGFYVSFTGNITYPKSTQAQEIVRYVPLNRFFLETDAPFLSPGNRRGERNAPAYLIETAQAVAHMKNEPVEEICRQTTENAIKFFKLPVSS